MQTVPAWKPLCLISADRNVKTKNMKTTIYILSFILTTIFTGCAQTNFPLTAKDCLKETGSIIKNFKTANYDSVLQIINKYPHYSNNVKYDIKSLKQEFDTLTKHLNANKHLNFYYKYGDEKLTESDLNGLITDRFAIYYCVKDKDNSEKQLCQFKYTFDNNVYNLDFMFHNLRKKVSPILPK